MVRAEEKKLVDEFLRDTGEKMLMLSRLIGKDVQISTGHRYDSINVHVFDCAADDGEGGSIYSVNYADNELNEADIIKFNSDHEIENKMDVRGLTDETVCGMLTWNNFMFTNEEENNA